MGRNECGANSPGPVPATNTVVAKYTTACRITGQNIHEIPQWNVSRPPRKIPLAV